MTKLKQVKKTDISYIFKVPYGNLYAQKIRGPLGADMSRYFAPLNTTVSNGPDVVWNVPDGMNGPFHCVKDDPEEGLLLVLWSEIESKIRHEMRTHGISDSEVDNLLAFPDTSYLFYVLNPGASDDVPEQKYTLLLTGWACRPGIGKNKGADDAEQKKLDAKKTHQRVTVVFQNSQGEIIPNHSFSYTYESKINRTIESSSNGMHHLGLCRVGSQIIYTDMETGIQQSFEVLANKEDYILAYPTKVMVTIRVLDQNDEPQSNFSLWIDDNKSSSWSEKTDGRGEIVLTDVLYYPDSILHIRGDKDVNMTYTLAPCDSELVIHIENALEVVPEPPTPEPPTPEPPTPHTRACHVVIRVVDQFNKDVPEYNIVVIHEDQRMNATTNIEGRYDAGTMDEDSLFRVEDADNALVYKEYIVRYDMEEYIFPIVIDVPLPDVTVSLEDKEQVRVTSARLTLKNKRGEEYIGITNANGSIVVPHSFFTNGEKVQVHVDIPGVTVHDCSFKYEEQCDQYVIRLKNPFPWGCLLRLLLALLLFGLLFVRCSKDITIQTEFLSGDPVPNAKVNMEYTEHQLYKNGEFFYSYDHSEVGVTDAEGLVTFENMPFSIFSWVVYNFQKANVCGLCNGRVATGSFLFHWRYTTYRLVFRDIMVQVVDAQTQTPILGASVHAWSDNIPDGEVVCTTDSMGYCTISVLNGDNLDKLLTTATDYNGDLRYNVMTDASIIIPLDRPATCDRGVNNLKLDQGNHAIFDFDMGQEGGTFLFEYFTDSAADHIMIYDGNSADYSSGNATKIFDYDGATYTRVLSDSAIVSFSSRYICVVVDNGTYWGYYVHCPD